MAVPFRDAVLLDRGSTEELRLAQDGLRAPLDEHVPGNGACAKKVRGPRPILICRGRLLEGMLKLSTIAVVVRDEKKAAKWWKEKIGLRIVDAWPHWHTVASRGSTVEMHICPDSPPEKGNTGISFTTTDAAKEEKALRAKGVKITMPTTKEEWGTYFMFADPDGNEFYAFER